MQIFNMSVIFWDNPRLRFLYDLCCTHNQTELDTGYFKQSSFLLQLENSGSVCNPFLFVWSQLDCILNYCHFIFLSYQHLLCFNVLILNNFLHLLFNLESTYIQPLKLFIIIMVLFLWYKNICIFFKILFWH